VQPAVWVWKRSIIERCSFSFESLLIIFAQRRRAALNLAISSNKLLCALKKKESLPAIHQRRARINSCLNISNSISQCKCYFLSCSSASLTNMITTMLIVFQCGFGATISKNVCRQPHGGLRWKICVPRAIYSLSMSFWTVPLILPDGRLVCLLRHIHANRIGAVEFSHRRTYFIQRNTWKRISMSSKVSTATPTLPTSPLHKGLSES